MIGATIYAPLTIRYDPIQMTHPNRQRCTLVSVTHRCQTAYRGKPPLDRSLSVQGQNRFGVLYPGHAPRLYLYVRPPARGPMKAQLFLSGLGRPSGTDIIPPAHGFGENKTDDGGDAAGEGSKQKIRHTFFLLLAEEHEGTVYPYQPVIGSAQKSSPKDQH